jgi:hypothetical protein
MKSDDSCSGCGQKDTCRQAYEKMGKASGPNVAWKAIVAFLVPIAVFIGVLAGSQRLLEGRLEGRGLTMVSFLLAVCVTLLVVFVIRAISGPIKKEHCDKR